MYEEGGMHRDMGQSSLAESLLPETLGNNERLERIDDAVDWGRFGRLVAGVYSACEGRPREPLNNWVHAT